MIGLAWVSGLLTLGGIIFVGLGLFAPEVFHHVVGMFAGAHGAAH
jgi:hypothetical protein